MITMDPESHATGESIEIQKHPIRGGYLLKANIFLARPIEEVFEFFSDAGNLELITPAILKFKVLSALPVKMEVGALIDYRLRLYGIPFRWRTRISEWDPPHRFADEQLRGPYRQWVHQHQFESVAGGTLCHDLVHYKVPGGSLVNQLFVERNVRQIFEHRQLTLTKFFA